MPSRLSLGGALLEALLEGVFPDEVDLFDRGLRRRVLNNQATRKNKPRPAIGRPTRSMGGA